MTEIPEHLLRALPRAARRRWASAAMAARARRRRPRRSRQRAVGHPGRPAPAAPAQPPPAAPPPAASPQPRPRTWRPPSAARKIPCWALPVVALLPVLGVHLRAVAHAPRGPRAHRARSPRARRSTPQTCSCAATAPAARGGVGRQLSGGEVVLTFPGELSTHQVEFVTTGSDALRRQALRRPRPARRPPRGRPSTAAGHAQGHAAEAPRARSPHEEVVAVVCYERRAHRGEDPAAVPGRRHGPPPRVAADVPARRRRAPRRRQAGAMSDPATTSSSSAAAPPGRPPRYWLAEAGHDVLVVERKTFPREKTCGDGLTPGRCTSSPTWAWPTELGATTTASTGCGPSPTASPSSWSGPSTPSSRRTATSCAAATSTRWWPSTP